MQSILIKIGFYCWVYFGLFSVLSAQSGVLDNIKDQNIDPFESFESIDVADYLLPGVNCATITITSTREKGDDTKPTTACEKTKEYHSTMNARLKIGYGQVETFNHPDDYLILYNDKDEIVECGSSSDLMRNDILLNEQVYTLSINGGSAKYPVRMEFFSGKDQKLYTEDSIFQYVQNNRMGQIGEPDVIDLAPISMGLQGGSMVVNPIIKDVEFEGKVCYTITVTDCDNGQMGSDEVCFIVGDEVKVCPPSEVLNTEIFTNQTYQAEKAIIASNIIRPSAKVTYQAGESIFLRPGFEVKAGGDFLATIADCNAGTTNATESENEQPIFTLKEKNRNTFSEKLEVEELSLRIIPNPVSAQAELAFYLPKAESVSIHLVDIHGQIIQKINAIENIVGWQKTILNTNSLPRGIYFITLQTPPKLIYKKIIKQ